MARREDFSVRFWGVRGTVPVPGPSTLRYGGNTSCVEICCGDQRLIFDAGTGIRALGTHLLKVGGRQNAHLFLSHTHVDHINGFAFFRLAYRAENNFEIWAGHLLKQGIHLHEVLAKMMLTPLFPVPIDIMHACIAFHDFTAGETLHPVPGITIRTAELNHPGRATGYRVEYHGKVVCYVTDTEHREGEIDPVIVELIRDADVMIYDATYTDEEYPLYRGWGHSTWQEGIRLCEAANVPRLVAFHHDPDHDDDMLDRIGAAMAERMPGAIVAREGMVLVP